MSKDSNVEVIIDIAVEMDEHVENTKQMLLNNCV